jgi:Nuclear transport factor 2 (NTF2) domain
VNSHTDADVLAAVEQSPRAAGRHDRAGWVGLFTAQGCVEDPVGSAPHRGHEQIGRFYDTFIAPRQITFHPDVDIVCGATVIRALTLEVQMGDAVTMMIPAVLRYAIADVDSELKISELQAFWELPAMMWQFVRHGVPAVGASTALASALLANQRLRGAAGFLRGLHRPARRQRPTVDALVDALAGGDELTVRRLLHAGARVTLGDDAPLTVDALTTRLRGATRTSCIAAGSTTAISVSVADGPAVLLIDTAPWRIRFYSSS